MPYRNSEMPFCQPISHHREIKKGKQSSRHPSLLLHNDRGKALGVPDVDGLDVAVQLLLGVLLVVSSPRDADADAVGNTLDALLPHLLVELGVETNVGGALQEEESCQSPCGLGVSAVVVERTMAWVAKALISLMARGALFLKVTPWS